jgi:hypothetical protein
MLAVAVAVQLAAHKELAVLVAVVTVGHLLEQQVQQTQVAAVAQLLRAAQES